MHFFIFTTKTIKVIFWKKLVVTSSFFTWNLASKWGNGKWKSSRTLSFLLQLWKVTRAHFSIISGVEVTPLGFVCLAFPLQGLCPLKMTLCFRRWRRLDVTWALLDWKNQLFWTFSECMSGLSSQMSATRLYLLCAGFSLSHQSISHISKNWKLPSVVTSGPLQWCVLGTGKEQAGYSMTSTSPLVCSAYIFLHLSNTELVLPHFAWCFPNVLRFWCVPRVNRPWLLIILSITAQMCSCDKTKQIKIYLFLCLLLTYQLVIQR